MKRKARKPEPRSVVYIVEEEGKDGLWRPISEWTTRRANAGQDKRECDEAAPGYKHRVAAYERRAK